MASTYIYRNNDATAGGGYSSTWTWSGWVKRGTLGEQGLFMNRRIDHVSNSRMRFQFSSSDNLFIETKDSTSNDGNYMETKMKFRDTNAWYHIVLAFDTTLSSTTDMIKIWINNKSIETELGGWNSPDRASNGFGTLWSSATRSMLGIATNNSNTDFMFDGSMSHVHFIYGTAYTPSAFGEYDATTGEWKGKTSPSVTYGSQGFFVLKDGNSATDQSGQSNNMTISGGTLTDLKDNPDNVFATWNFLSSPSNGNVGDVTGSNGNTTTSTLSSGYRSYPATLGYTTGKFYWEIKRNNTTNDCHLGITNEDLTPANQATWIGNTANGWMYGSDGGLTYNSGTDTNTGYSTSTTGDIIMVAHDATNGKLYFGKNGSWQGSSNPETEASPAFTGLSTSKFWFPAFSAGSSNSANFGNGYFGTTAITTNSGNGYSGAEGSSKFNYTVPTGYSALSTKGLNE